MVKIRLSFQEVVYLHDAHLNKVQPGTGPYYELLREHAADFCLFFERLMNRGSKSYQVKLTSLQALAFMQLWLNQPLPDTGYWVVARMIQSLDQAHLQNKLLNEARQYQDN